MQSGRAADHLVTVHERLPAGQERSAFYLLYDWHGGETLQQQLDRGQQVQRAAGAGRRHPDRPGAGPAAPPGRDPPRHQARQPAPGRRRRAARARPGRGAERARARGACASCTPARPATSTPSNGATAPQRPTAPEELPDAQSDLFALGVTLYQLLTGRLPYGEVLPYQVGRYYRDPVAPSRINPEVPIWLDHIVLKAVARDKRKRFETAEELLLALERGASRPLTRAAGHAADAARPDGAVEDRAGGVAAVQSAAGVLAAVLPK